MIKDQKFFTQLDGLRCFAVALTMIAHWFPAVGWPLIPYSWNGVDIFFVISGFLITLLLIRQKEGRREPKLIIIKNFMVRRVLRLFPLYYLFILFFLVCYKVFNLYLWNPHLAPYLFTYTSNIFYNNGGAGDAVFNHTWSLAVEEQFYLLWPWFVIFINPKYFLWVILSFIMLAFIVITFPETFKFIVFPPLKNFNTLGAGALLAYLGYYKNTSSLYKYIFNNRVLLAIVTILIYLVIIILMPRTRYYEIIRELSLTLAGFFLVFNTVIEWKGIIGKFLASRPIAYIGKISYGIYLIHMPVPSLFNVIKNKFYPSLIISPILQIGIYLTITLLLASFSYRFIETPFLRLKKYFK